MLFGRLCGLEVHRHPGGREPRPARLHRPVRYRLFARNLRDVHPRHGRPSARWCRAPQHRFHCALPEVLRLTWGATGIPPTRLLSPIFLLQFCGLLGATAISFTGVTRLPMAAGEPPRSRVVHAPSSAPSPPTNSIACVAALVFALVLLGSAGVHRAGSLPLVQEPSLPHY